MATVRGRFVHLIADKLQQMYEEWARGEGPMAINQLYKCPFPKHEGERWEDVVEDDRDYVEWLVSHEGPELDEDLYDKLIELLEET